MSGCYAFPLLPILMHRCNDIDQSALHCHCHFDDLPFCACISSPTPLLMLMASCPRLRLCSTATVTATTDKTKRQAWKTGSNRRWLSCAFGAPGVQWARALAAPSANRTLCSPHLLLFGRNGQRRRGASGRGQTLNINNNSNKIGNFAMGQSCVTSETGCPFSQAKRTPSAVCHAGARQ